jgi:hypothetical protein
MFSYSGYLQTEIICVAGGQLTNPITNVCTLVLYPSVEYRRLIVLLADLNGLKVWGADVRNVYLEATTKERVYIIGGLELGSLEGHTLMIHNAINGIQSSCLPWHECLADILQLMGYTP